MRMEEHLAKERVNLSVDGDALERGRRYGRRHGLSLSRLVTDFLRALPEEDSPAGPLPPAVRRLLGVGLGGGDREDYRRHLEEKYGR